jgi:hypothetical protein
MDRLERIVFRLGIDDEELRELLRGAIERLRERGVKWVQLDHTLESGRTGALLARLVVAPSPNTAREPSGRRFRSGAGGTSRQHDGQLAAVT